jgi:hypothetical protein
MERSTLTVPAHGVLHGIAVHYNGRCPADKMGRGAIRIADGLSKGSIGMLRKTVRPDGATVYEITERGRTSLDCYAPPEGF